MFKFNIGSKQHIIIVFYMEENNPSLRSMGTMLEGDNTLYDSFIYGTRNLKTLEWTAHYEYNGEKLEKKCSVWIP